MRAQILVTFFSRFGTAVTGFVIAILLSQFLGAAGKGEASLLILNITLINLLTNVMGGAAIVFLAPRYSNYTLILVSYLWITAVAAVLAIISIVFHIHLPVFNLHTIALATLLAWFHTNTNYLLGKQKTNTFNVLNVLQGLITLLFLLAAFYGNFIVPDYSVYIYGLYLGYGVSFVASLFFALKEVKTYAIEDVSAILTRYIKHGGYSQLANLAQLLIYRASFYIITYYAGLKALGVYSNAIALAESVWIVSRSIATVQYAKVANEGNVLASAHKTIQLRQNNVLIAIGLATVLCVLPDTFYTQLFGRDFTGLQQLIWWFSPGIVAFAYYNITTHFFSGIGKNHYNTLISFTGFAITVAIGFYLIPRLGTKGAAITSSIVYILNAAQAEYLLKKLIKRG